MAQPQSGTPGSLIALENVINIRNMTKRGIYYLELEKWNAESGVLT